jgi:UDPglucose 6-dehydrogenase
MKALLRHPVILDGRNIFHPARMREHGFAYYSIGRPAALPNRID